MRKTIVFLLLLAVMALAGCSCNTQQPQIAATTAPVYDFTTYICNGTDIQVAQLVTENVSCLHDYTLQTAQMRIVENAELVILSGAGLESFLEDVLVNAATVLDASEGISLLCVETDDDHEHHEHEHAHDTDPHIWLSPANAKIMIKNIYRGLSQRYPQHESIFKANLQSLLEQIDTLDTYAIQQLSTIPQKKIITFHDGFSYLADAYGFDILHAIEEESGSEASAAELIDIVTLVQENKLTCIFTECNGSTSASQIISAETGVEVFQLDMAMSERDYFAAMYHNIDTLKEALE